MRRNFIHNDKDQLNTKNWTLYIYPINNKLNNNKYVKISLTCDFFYCSLLSIRFCRKESYETKTII
jgi:hypothetical protein